MEEKKYIILRENLIQSLLADISTFGFLLGTVWFNYKFIGNSGFINGIILIMFVVFLIQISRVDKFYNKEEAIKYINKK